MAKERFVFCNGPHAGPCPRRMMRLLRETGKFPLTGCSAADVFRRIVELGRGGEDLRCEAAGGGACPHGADKPFFDEDTNELSVRGEVIYRFAPQASNVIAVLKAFEEQGWGREIFDPLGNARDLDFRKRLQDTATALKRALGRTSIVFSTTASRRKIRWDFPHAQE